MRGGDGGSADSAAVSAVQSRVTKRKVPTPYNFTLADGLQLKF